MPNDAADRPDRADLYRMADDGCPNSTGDTHLHDLAQLWATHENGKAPVAGRGAASPPAGSRKRVILHAARSETLSDSWPREV